MLRLSTRRPRRSRLRPGLEALENRALLAIGQIGLAFPIAPVGVSPPIPALKGLLPDGSFDVYSYSFNTQNPVTIGTSSGAGFGKVSFQPLTITLPVGLQSPALFQVMASGGYFPSLRLDVRNDAGSLTARYELGLAFLTNITTSASSGDDAPTETYQFVYGSLRLTTFDPIALKTSFVGSWNQIRNTPDFLTNENLSAFRFDATAEATDDPSARTQVATTAEAGATATTVTLRSRRQAGPDGPTITYTARVTSDSGVPTGAVTFYAGSTRLGDADVGPDGRAVLTVPASVVGRARAYAIYSGGLDSAFLPSTTVTGGGQVRRLFRDNMGRSMTADEWALTSIWLNQGRTVRQMGAVYRNLAKQLRG